MVDREVDGQHALSLIYFFDILDGCPERDVDGPVWVILGRSGGLCVRSWVALGAYVGGLGAVLGPILAILGGSWASTGVPGPLWGPM